MTLKITSAQNPSIKFILKLRNKSARDETKKMLIEGYREIERALQGMWQLEKLFVCPEFFLGSNEPTLIENAVKAGAEIIDCSKDVFQKISYRDRPDGLLAIAAQKKFELADLSKLQPKNRAPFYVVAEAIEKPGNLGTILRSADAAGADGVIVCDRCTDIFNPNVVRASVGTLFTVPILESSSEKVLKWLRNSEIKVLAATPSASLNFTEVDLNVPVAIALGTEQLGLSKFWMEEADLKVKIAMHGIADSLNVAMASTLLLYEVVRQRGLK